MRNNRRNSGLVYWKLFLEEFEKLPEEDQLAIIMDYEETEREERNLDVEKMWGMIKDEESKREKEL
jgi:hypothetical protein